MDSNSSQERLVSQNSFEEAFNYQERQQQYQFVIQEKYLRMIRDKHESPSLIIPSNFKQFIVSQDFFQLLRFIDEYSFNINLIEKKNQFYQGQQNAEFNIGKSKEIQKAFLISKELQDAQTALREVTLRYSLIILKWGNLELRNRDQHFFETTIYFICQILKEFYSRSDFYFIEEEVNRLFRTNIFNITKRRHLEDQKVKKYPVLKENKMKQPMENILANLQKRRFIPQTRLNKEMGKENSNYRPFFLKSSPCASTQSRSPLVSEFYPAKREALYQLEKNKQQSQQQEMLKKKQYFSKSNQFNIIDNQKGLQEQIKSFSHQEVLENFKNLIKSRNLQIDLTNNNKTFLNNNRTFKLSPIQNNIPENRIKSFQTMQKQRVRNKTMI